MRYVIARTNIENREMAYRFYVTDGLKMITESAAHLAGGGEIFSRSFRDLIKPTVVSVDTRTSEDIINDIKSKLKAME